MSDIRLVDVSIRDGNQSLWSMTGLNTRQILQIAPVMARVGFKAIDFTSSTHMAVAVRYHQDDPWARIRRMHAAVPGTPLQFISTGFRFISWETADHDFMRLVCRKLMENGIGRFALLDPMHDMDALMAVARIVKEEGEAENMAALTYTISAVHDDAFYAACAARIAQCPYFDRTYLKDPSGLLTAERARSLIPAITNALGGMPLELHSHSTIGLAQFNYLSGADLGIEALHVAVGPLADGSSLPPADRTISNLREQGHRVDVDERALTRMTEYFTALAQAEGLPAGQPQSYDARYLRHQIAGGVLTTTRRQLAELHQEDKFDAVMEEVEQVRSELGSPIMVTPFPQIVCTQALLNLVGEERYGNVPDQVIKYVLGRFGRPTGVVDEQVMDRIMSLPRTKELQQEPAMMTLKETRKRFPASLSDEEFLLRAVMPRGQVDAMINKAPCRPHYNPETRALLKLLRDMKQRPAVAHFIVEKPGFRLQLRAGAAPGGRADTAAAAESQSK
jgi:oxaloacetate decarboxylase alpha subunit